MLLLEGEFVLANIRSLSIPKWERLRVAEGGISEPAFILTGIRLGYMYIAIIFTLR